MKDPLNQDMAWGMRLISQATLNGPPGEKGKSAIVFEPFGGSEYIVPCLEIR